MKKMKKLLIPLLAISLTSGTVILTSCGGKPEETKNEVTYSVTLSESLLDLCLGDSYLLKANISGGKMDTTLVFKSLNEDVVSISDTGLITTHKPGTAEIRAIYGTSYAKCIVNVIIGENVPSINIPSVLSGSIQIDKTTTVNIKPSIKFNNKEYDFTPTYEVSDESIGKVEGDIFKPLANGTVFVTIRGSLFGKPAVPYTLQIDITDNTIIFMKEVGGVELSNVHLFTHKGKGPESLKMEFTPEFGVYINDQLIDSPNLEVNFVDTDNVFTYDASTMKISSTNNAGSAYYSVKYTDDNSNVFYKTFDAYNNKTILEYEGDVVETDSFGTTLPLNDIFKDFANKDLVKATSLDQETEYEVSDNMIIGLPTSIDGAQVGNQKFILFNDTVGYIVDLKVYTKIIKTAADLNVFTMENTSSIIKGYYTVANDIDGLVGGEKTVINHHARTAGAAYNFYPETGFVGIFEGNGHVIKNIMVGEGGLFGLLSKGSIVRNIAFTNVDFRKEANKDDTPLLATYCNGCVISNVYIHNDFIRGGNNASLVAVNVMNNCSISHCLFELGDYDPKTYCGNGNYGVIGSMYGEKATLPEASKSLFSETYVISKTPLVHNNGNSVKYVVDSDPRFKETNTDFEFYSLLNIVHFMNVDEMKSSTYTFDSFSKDYWTVREDHVLTWKSLGEK